MFRSVTITHPVVVNDGKPFDAYRAEVYRYGRGVYLSLRTHVYVNKCLITIGIPKNGVFSYKDDHIHRCVSVLQYQVAQALNSPIKVTQAVLDAMEKVHEAKFRTQEKCPATASPIYYLCFYEGGGGTWEKGWHYWTPSDYSIFGKFNKVEEGDYIQADCPLALQVLLGFTVEGVPKDD